MAATASLSAASTPGPGVTVTQTGRLVSAQIVPSSSSTQFDVAIEATIDGVNWVRVGRVSDMAANGLWTSSQYAFASVRANLLSVSGGTVSAEINSI